MRISSVQKDILFVLYQLELRGVVKPIAATDILMMVNQSRNTEVFGTNFRVSCHKLNEHGLVHMHRNLKSLTLSFRLTDAGREKASKLKMS
ncbi:hypothetical protein TUM4438_41460 [Shewanella sairae]|uniref:Chromosome segregation protein ParM n=1 Tax=Shewanella sairae TaxID=190310 RepID=A0ABQ4PQN3_9GAMM|nr:chromosome segregation protein ParM [Shewanella sairae]MCL1132368.1 chromosome segregation protein ParM [Shewanella sairae]GIU51528.1 hypothetical protein TUM4438_41460 [Shewanella sairae]